MSMQTAISAALGGTPAPGDVSTFDVLAFRAINTDDQTAANAAISAEVLARYGFTPIGPQILRMYWLLLGAKESLL